MQAQTLASKGELLIDVQGKIVSRTVKEITPHGVKLEMNMEGQTTGRYSANVLSTVSTFMKTDGTSEWENRAIHTTRDGDVVVVSGRGTGRMAGPGKSTMQGELVYMTQSPNLAWLNNTKGWVEGNSDMATGVFQGKVYTAK